ncbi:MAG: DUF4386 domain-containing protein, partial [Actinomycetia bacterium]|nr:DUF4386 domain-containing protein [Actinomycetes bacterium]
MQQTTPSTEKISARTADKADRGVLRFGRVFGALVLAAFVLYGVGSSLADQPIGLVLVGFNSMAVALIGGIGFRLLRSSRRTVGGIYLVARLTEAILLFIGVAFAGAVASSEFGQAAYLGAMIALGAGSVPFFLALKQGRWLPGWFAVWGVVGYAMLATGAFLELASGRSVALAFAVPGGLFELALGMFLVWRGFGGMKSRSRR